MLPRMVRKREGGSRNQVRWLRIRKGREEMRGGDEDEVEEGKR